MHKLMRLSAILAFIGSGSLFGMEAYDADNQLMALSLEQREPIYSYMTDSDLSSLSITSKDSYVEIYKFKKRKAGILELKKGYKISHDRYLDALRNQYRNLELKMSDKVCYYNTLIMNEKRNKNIIKQPWMIQNGEKEDS